MRTTRTSFVWSNWPKTARKIERDVVPIVIGGPTSRVGAVGSVLGYERFFMRGRNACMRYIGGNRGVGAD